MTLIISWIGVDNKKDGNKVASLYIASDSRYTWKNVGGYDYGIKVFGAVNFPEIFGFCGDVLFPSIIISQLISHIDNGVFFKSTDDFKIKSEKVQKFITDNLKLHPLKEYDLSFTILYGSRVGKEFHLGKFEFKPKREVVERKILDLPTISSKVFSGGSGAKEFDKQWLQYENSKHNEHGTSRGVYQCLVKTIKNINDPFTGGAPQIIGLYRIRNSILFGSVLNEKLYIYGKECVEIVNSGNIEWRNENFERTNPETKKIIDGAQRQPS